MIQIISLFEPWIIGINWFTLLIISTMYFFRRIGGFRRVGRRIAGRFRKVSRIQRKFSKTDPKIYDAIYSSSHKSMTSVLNRKGSRRVNDKKVKKEVKKKVAIDIERRLQQSPMRKMRPLVNTTIDEMIDLALLKEVRDRGSRLNITHGSPFGPFFWRLVFPIAIAVIIGWVSYNYPLALAPGSLTIPPAIPPPVTGVPPPIDPIPIIQSALINVAVYGIGTLAVVGVVIFLRSL